MLYSPWVRPTSAPSQLARSTSGLRISLPQTMTSVGSGSSRELGRFDRAPETSDGEIHATRLVDEIDRTPLEGQALVFGQGPAGQEDDRQVHPASPQQREQVDARRLRKASVENEDDVGLDAGVERAEQRGAIGKTPAGKSTFRQLGDEKLTVVPAVFDEKDTHGAVCLAGTGKSLQWTGRLKASRIRIRPQQSSQTVPTSHGRDPKDRTGKHPDPC